jgi:hypothetical protein
MRSSRMRIFLFAAFGLGTIWLAWSAFANAVVSVTRIANPSLALQFVSSDPIAIAAKVDDNFTTANSLDVFRRGLPTLGTSVQGQALNPRALRLIGFVAETSGDISKARRLFGIAARMSRRDVGAQIWLIDDAVTRGDADQALEHFDTALRTTSAANSSLLPILIDATEERSLIAPLAKILGQAPPWRFSFYNDLVAKGPSALNIQLLYELLNKTSGAFNDDAIRGLIGRLANEKLFRQAANVYQNASGTRHHNSFNNPTFDIDGNLAPFDWVFADADGVRGSRMQVSDGDDGNYALFYDLEPNSNGEIARQLLVLPQGRYRVVTTRRAVRGAHQALLSWQVQCAEGAGQLLSADDGPDAHFTVPTSDCSAQWAILRGTTTGQRASGWVDNAAIVSN